MTGTVRNFFPGGNTPEGFFSYYRYILGQREASGIVCIKGGPGTGKSGFMKGIAEHFSKKGEDVDLFWCSSDPDSLDGILLRERKIAFLDGTKPHIVDPVTPGAVDQILNMGNYWDGEALKRYKSYIMQSNDTIRQWFTYGYNNLKAAASLRKTLKEVYHEAMLPGEVYMVTSDIINREFSHRKVTLAEGMCKKYFATAITPEGHINHMLSLIKNYGKLYFLAAPLGFETEEILRIVSENAVHRGFSVEQYYCPMDPAEKIEHLLIPELDLGFITLNPYHDMELWECSAAVINLDMREYIDWNAVEKYRGVIEGCESGSNALINEAIECLKNAKKEHDVLEGYYVPNMDFEKIEDLKEEWIGKIEENKV